MVEAVDVGVIMYCTVPAVELLGLDSVCAIVAPDPGVAPVIPPVTAPIVQLNVLAAVDARTMLVVPP